MTRRGVTSRTKRGSAWTRIALYASALAAALCVVSCTGTTPPPTAPPASGDPGSRPAAPPPPAAAPPRYRYLTDLSDGAQARRYGFNLVDLGPYRSLIDALPQGERALVWLGGYSPDNCRFVTPDATIHQQLSALAGDPKVAGYYLADEADDALPRYGGHCPDVAAQIAARNRLVHQLAPGPFTYEVVTEPGNFAAFARATDVMGTDPYPCLVGRPCDWSQIPRYIAALDAAHVARYWGLLQAFSYEKWRTPTRTELARMISQWQHSRWQGVQVFSWEYQGWSLSSHPNLLAELSLLNLGK